MASDSEALPSAVAEVVEYRRAARRIVQDPTLSVSKQCAGLIRLAARARQEAESPDLCQGAIWAEAEVFVTTGERPMDRQDIADALAASDPVDLALRGLLRGGRIRCPRCLRSLLNERELDHQARLARVALEEALVRDEAVDA
jgi:hypothetical protein